jgi:serine/threonine protein kinase
VAAAALCAAFAAFLVRRRRRQSTVNKHNYSRPLPLLSYSAPAAPAAASTTAAQSFTGEQLAACTSNFSTELGKGAFGAVFGGTLPDGRRVAVKQMSLEATALEKDAETTVTGANKFTGEAGFRRELEVLGRCAHENIVLLFGYCIEKREVGRSTFSLVIEFMPGGSLLDALKPGSRQPPLAAAQRLDVASDVARGLHYLHTEALLIHQDVKSDNVLLAANAASGRIVVVAKVADFGTARVVPKQAMQAHHSTRVVIGTTPYMPMEYLQSGHVSEKTDTYAFGVVLCELLTGKPPFDSGTGELLAAQMQQMLQVQQPEAVLLPQLLDARAGAWPRGGAAMELARTAQRCMLPFAHDRCTVRDVVRSLDVLAGRAPTPPHPTTISQRPSGMSMTAPQLGNQSSAASRGVCRHCGAKLRFRAGNALPCFTCRR